LTHETEHPVSNSRLSYPWGIDCRSKVRGDSKLVAECGEPKLSGANLPGPHFHIRIDPGGPSLPGHGRTGHDDGSSGIMSLNYPPLRLIFKSESSLNQSPKVPEPLLPPEIAQHERGAVGRGYPPDERVNDSTKNRTN
jgi:hypothetical protein